MFFRLCLFASILFFSIPARADGLQLEFETSFSAPQSGETAKEDHTVTLYPDKFTLHIGPILQIFDFSTRRFLVVNEKEKSYVSHSLYFYPIARANEKRNRETLRKAVQIALKRNIPLQTQLEMDMELGSLSDTKTADDIKTLKKDGETLFSGEDKILARFTDSKITIPKELRASYAHFLIYQMSMHPAIKQAMGKQGHIFKNLSFTNTNSGMKAETAWVLKKGASVKGGMTLPADYKRFYSQDAKLDAAIRSAYAEAPPTKQELESRVKAFRDKKDTLRATLATLQMGLILSPVTLEYSDIVNQTLADAGKDPLTRETLLAISPGSGLEIAARIKAFDKARETVPDFAWQIDLYQANFVISRLREDEDEAIAAGSIKTLKDARGALERAIIASPWLLGAYHDLGDLAFQTWDVTDALDYYDAARHINPQHPLLSQNKLMLEQIDHNFPEYF